MSKEEAEPLLLQAETSDAHGLQDSDEALYKKGPKGKSTIISLQKPVAEHDYSITGEHYDPLSERDVEHPTSNCDTMIHLLKGNIGTGILAMPDAFRNAGLAVGTLGTVFIGIICVHTMQLLVKCAHDLCRRTQTPSLNFAEVAEVSFKVGPPPLRRFSTFARMTIDGFLCVTQLGFCCVYFVFVAQNIKHVVDPYLSIVWPVQSYMALLLIPMVLLNYLRNLKLLAPFMMVANICMAIGLGIIFYYIFREPLPPIHRENFNAGFSSWQQLPLYFGTAIYAFEGIGMILPLENSMKNPHEFGGMTGVLNTSMVIVGCLYTAVGFFGYLKYGDSISGSITLNLVQGEMLSDSVRLMMALSIFLSYSLQFYVPMDIMWPAIKQRIPTERMQLISEYLFRTLLVIFTFAMAELIPNLGLFISLVGAVSSSTLALIFPPLIPYILTSWSKGYGKYRWELWKDLSVMLFGAIGFVAGSYVSMRNILQEASPEDN